MEELKNAEDVLGIVSKMSKFFSGDKTLVMYGDGDVFTYSRGGFTAEIPTSSIITKNSNTFHGGIDVELFLKFLKRCNSDKTSISFDKDKLKFAGGGVKAELLVQEGDRYEADVDTTWGTDYSLSKECMEELSCLADVQPFEFHDGVVSLDGSWTAFSLKQFSSANMGEYPEFEGVYFPATFIYLIKLLTPLVEESCHVGINKDKTWVRFLYGESKLYIPCVATTEQHVEKLEKIKRRVFVESNKTYVFEIDSNFNEALKAVEFLEKIDSTKTVAEISFEKGVCTAHVHNTRGNIDVEAAVFQKKGSSEKVKFSTHIATLVGLLKIDIKTIELKITDSVCTLTFTTESETFTTIVSVVLLQ